MLAGETSTSGLVDEARRLTGNRGPNWISDTTGHLFAEAVEAAAHGAHRGHRSVERRQPEFEDRSFQSAPARSFPLDRAAQACGAAMEGKGHVSLAPHS